MSFVHLHTKSWYSFRRGGSSPDALVQQALLNGQTAVGLTDYMSTAGVIPFQVAARAKGLKSIVGAEVLIEGYPLVMLAASQTGFRQINQMISRGFELGDAGVMLEEIREDSSDVFVLTGGCSGRLWELLATTKPHSALEWVKRLLGVFGQRLFVEVSSHLCEGDARMVGKLLGLARTARVHAVMTNDVGYAVPEDAVRLDALILSRHRLQVQDDHTERPSNREAWLKPQQLLEQIVGIPSLFANTVAIANECFVDLLPERIEIPRARLPENTTADLELEGLARAGIKRRYPLEQHKTALKLMSHELEVIEELGLAEYFLVVHEVIEAARAMRIRTAGRGSAASSIVVYALGIAHADPLKFRLRFERFLNTGRFVNKREAPDIDVDVQSERRQELIEWVTQRFKGQTAMAANINTYGLRNATRDAARLLGWTHDQAGELTRVLPYSGRPRHIRRHTSELEKVAGTSVLLEVLLSLVERLDDCPRDLGLHSGGMLLARDSILNHSAVKRSANGTLQTFLDKRTAEYAGLVKLDLLGLLTLDVLQTAIELLEGLGITVDLEMVDLDDSRIYAGLKDGKVIGLFQVESPAQQALIAQLQPENFLDLVAQVALIRPGPIQAQSVRPYIKRRKGLEKVAYPHSCLEPVLRQTYGVMVFQDQAIETAQVICGMSIDEADKFRKLVSKARDRDDMEAMREVFTSRAKETHADIDHEKANMIFEMVAGFAGYGFPLSHSVAFATTAAHTAYLKALYPAAFLCAVLEHEPGMYPRLTITEEARRLGIVVLPVCLENSGSRFLLEWAGEGLGIRLAFTAIGGLSEAMARVLVAHRQEQAFLSLEDLVRRSKLPKDALFGLARAGALSTFGERRDVLWELGVLENRLAVVLAQAEGLFQTPVVLSEDLAWLEGLRLEEELEWDLAMTRTSGVHPLAVLRVGLELAGVRATNRIYDGQRCSVAGLVIARQRPETAGGFLFLLLEDEFGHVQAIVQPELWLLMREVLRARALVVTGKVQRLRGWKTVVVEKAEILETKQALEGEMAYFVR
jgi:error-prone DNA polymerase